MQASAARSRRSDGDGIAPRGRSRRQPQSDADGGDQRHAVRRRDAGAAHHLHGHRAAAQRRGAGGAAGQQCQTAGIVAAVLGAWVSPRVPGDGHILMVLTALLLMWSAINMIRSVKPREPVEAKTRLRSSQSFLATLTGVCAGGLSGLLGLGGGIIMVPLFRRWLGLPIKNAVATSLICVGCFAVPGTITHALEGGIDWRFALWLTAGVVVGAPFGSKTALKMSDKKLQRVFGLFLAAVAVVYGVGELLAL